MTTPTDTTFKGFELPEHGPGVRVIVDMPRTMWHNSTGVIATRDADRLWVVSLDEPVGIFTAGTFSVNNLVVSPYQGEEIVSINGHD